MRGEDIDEKKKRGGKENVFLVNMELLLIFILKNKIIVIWEKWEFNFIFKYIWNIMNKILVN